MVSCRWSLLTQLSSVIQALLTFTIRSSSIFLLWISLVEWEYLYLRYSGPIVPHPYCAFCHGHQYSLCRYVPCCVILSIIMLLYNSILYIHIHQP